MTGDILDSVLTKVNHRGLQTQNHFIALLMDNAGCHSPEIEEKYSNIKVVLFPPITTSIL